jgi:hypothetical protein
MANRMQCKTCGAVLTAEDEFCGECGTPVPPAAEATGRKAPQRRPTSPPPAKPKRGPETGWRAAFLILVVVGALACLAGLVSFLFAGFIPSEGYTTEENWALATICCLLPLAGSGAILLVTGLGIWYSRLRND